MAELDKPDELNDLGPTPEQLMSGQVAPNDQSGAPARELERAELEAAGDIGANSDQAPDAQEINKNEAAGGWDYSDSPNQPQKVNSQHKKKLGLGVAGGLGFLAVSVTSLTMVLGGWASLVSFGKFIDQLYNGANQVQNVRSVKNAARKTAITNPSDKLRKSKLFNISDKIADKTIKRLATHGFDLDATLSGRTVRNVSVDMEKLLGEEKFKHFDNLSEAGKKEFIKQRFKIEVEGEVKLTGNRLSLEGRALNRTNTLNFVNSVDSLGNGKFSNVRKFFTNRFVAGRLGISGVFNLWGRAVNSVDKKLDNLVMGLRGAVKKAGAKLVNSSRKLSTLASKATNVMQSIKEAAKKLRRVSLASFIVSICTTVYCMIKAFYDAKGPDVEYQTKVVPAIHEFKAMQNNIDTFNSGELAREDSELTLQAGISSYLYNETTYEELDENASADCQENFNTNQSDQDGDGENDKETLGGSKGTSGCAVVTKTVKSSAVDANLIRAEMNQSWKNYSDKDIPYSNLETFRNLRHDASSDGFLGGLQSVFSTFLNGVFNNRLGNAICSKAGQIIIDVVGTAGEIALTIASGGGAAAIKAVIMTVIIFTISALVTSLLGDDGTEDNNTLLDTTHAESEAIVVAYGAQFAKNEAMIDAGATVLSEDEYNSQTADYRQQLASEYEQKPWFEKVFDPTDQRSAIATIGRALNLNLSESSLWLGLKNTGAVLLSLPQIFGRIFSPNYSLDAAHATAGKFDYGIDHYGYTEDFQNKLLGSKNQDNDPHYDWDAVAERIITYAEEDPSVLKEINDRLRLCNYRKKIADDGTVSGLEFESDTRYYRPDAKFADCDKENEDWWTDARIYVLDYRSFAIEACADGEKDFCGYDG